MNGRESISNEEIPKAPPIIVHSAEPESVQMQPMQEDSSQATSRSARLTPEMHDEASRQSLESTGAGYVEREEPKMCCCFAPLPEHSRVKRYKTRMSVREQEPAETPSGLLTPVDAPARAEWTNILACIRYRLVEADVRDRYLWGAPGRGRHLVDFGAAVVEPQDRWLGFALHKLFHFAAGLWFGTVWIFTLTFYNTLWGFTLYTVAQLFSAVYSVLFFVLSNRAAIHYTHKWSFALSFVWAAIAASLVVVKADQFFVRMLTAIVMTFVIPQVIVYVARLDMECTFRYVVATLLQCFLCLCLFEVFVENTFFLAFVVPFLVFTLDKTTQITLSKGFEKETNIEGCALISIFIVTLLEGTRFMVYFFLVLERLDSAPHEVWSNLVITLVLDVIIQSRFFSYEIKPILGRFIPIAGISAEWTRPPDISTAEYVDCYIIDAMFTASATLPEYNCPWILLFFFNVIYDCNDINTGKSVFAAVSWVLMQLVSEVVQLAVVYMNRFERIAVIQCVGHWRLAVVLILASCCMTLETVFFLKGNEFDSNDCKFH